MREYWEVTCEEIYTEMFENHTETQKEPEISIEDFLKKIAEK